MNSMNKYKEFQSIQLCTNNLRDGYQTRWYSGNCLYG